MAWDPSQYLSFASERLRPALDLLSHVPLTKPNTVVDLGCGAGNVTRYLRERWPEATLVGIDNSPEMLHRARTELPSVEFVLADAETWVPDEPIDVLYSNAVLHWLTDHRSLFSRLIGCVAPEGYLAVQMPRNFAAPSHQALYATVRNGGWSILQPLLAEERVKTPMFYYDRLSPLVSSLDVWETEYLQVLDGPNPVAEYGKGSWLRPFLTALAEPERSQFEAQYRERVLAHYPARDDGRTLFPFRRLFIVAKR